MKWKKQLFENVAGVFSRKQEPEVEEMKELIDKRYKKIGEQDKERHGGEREVESSEAT